MEDAGPYSLQLLDFEQRIMHLSKTFLVITAIGMAVAAPLDKCSIWIGTAPSCNVSPSDCPSGYEETGSSRDARGTEEPCLTGTKYLCVKSIFLFPKINI